MNTEGVADVSNVDSRSKLVEGTQTYDTMKETKQCL